MAEVNGNRYTSFQDAVDAAGDKATVEVLKNENLTATMSGSSRTITVKNGTGESITVTINGKMCIRDRSYTGTINGVILYDSTDAEKHQLKIKGNGHFGGVQATSGAADAAKSAVAIYGGYFNSDPSAVSYTHLL